MNPMLAPTCFKTSVLRESSGLFLQRMAGGEREEKTPLLMIETVMITRRERERSRLRAKFEIEGSSVGDRHASTVASGAPMHPIFRGKRTLQVS